MSFFILYLCFFIHCCIIVIMKRDMIHRLIDYDDSQSLVVHDIGYEDFRTRKPFDRFRIQNLYILHLVISGKGVYMTGGNRYELGKNDAFMCFPEEPICYFPDGTEPYRYYWISFSGPETPFVCQKLGFSLGEAVKRVYGIESLVGSFEALLYDQGAVSGFAAKSLLYKTAALLADTKNVTRKRTGIKSQYFARIKDYMELNYKQSELRIEDIAQFLHISHVYLCKIFKEFSGISAVSYLKNLRLDKAYQLLDTGEYNVTQVCLSTGYTDPAYFSREFRDKFGVTPGSLLKR